MAYTTIDDPSAHFHTLLYTGDGNSGRALTNSANAGDLQPDWVWIKKRAGGSARAHNLYDSTRGATKLLHSNSSDQESTQNAGLTAFGTNGFTLGSDDGVNGSGGGTYVAWQWKANGGSATATGSESGSNPAYSVQANTTAGFSIVTYTGTGSNGTVPHGLGVKPDWYIIKNRDNTNANDGRWMVWHKSLEALHNYYSFIFLHLTNSRSEGTTVVNATPNTTTFALGDDGMVNNDGEKYVAYCFADKQGYSKFGSYTGNGNADGPFVYTGFKPAWLMIKRTSGTENWVLWDNKRDPFNNFYHVLLPNATSTEDTTNTGSGGRYIGDFLSNGFKLRNTHDTSNGSGSTYIYMAFAEHPFVSSKGVPVTAR